MRIPIDGVAIDLRQMETDGRNAQWLDKALHGEGTAGAAGEAEMTEAGIIRSRILALLSVMNDVILGGFGNGLIGR